MRVLFSTGSSARYMAPPRLSDEQVNCGPDWLNRDIGGWFSSLHTPSGEYDLAAIAAQLPREQQPDAVVCLVDAAWRALPRNLRAFRCPKVLLVADTHHLSSPVTGMVRYALSEPFDRVVLLYDRHHWEFFQAAGLRQLFWFPGLTFPHSDATVAAARDKPDRAHRLAFVGQTGICHPRRTQMLSHLNAHAVPLSIKAVSQREGLDFYGDTLVGFNTSLNGDLNLRVFEIMASGAMLLTDQLTEASGLADLWKSGRDLVTYANPLEMVEQARHAIAHPEEAKKIGEAGARWFDTHFTEAIRQAAFAALVVSGVARPEFALPEKATFSASRSAPLERANLILGYEYVQELHRNLERVVVALDESVPEAFAQMCLTLPRLEVLRGLPAKGKRVDFLAAGRASLASPALATAAHVWAWNAGESDRMLLIRRCASMGLTLIDGKQLMFCRQRVNTHASEGAIALACLEQGSYKYALSHAELELAKNPNSVDALIVLAELAFETGDAAMARTTLSKLRSLAPHHPRVRELSGWQPDSFTSLRPARLTRTARALCDQQKWAEARQIAQDAVAADSKSGEAHRLLGRILAEDGKAEKSLDCLATAAQCSPDNAEHWYELGCALRAGLSAVDGLGALLHAVALEPTNAEYQFALGEAALAGGHGMIACEALDAACRLQPANPVGVRWLEQARRLRDGFDYAQPRDLLLSHVEVNRLQGTGVLLERFFPDSSSFVTIRSRSLYQGAVHFGGSHLVLGLPCLTGAARRAVLGRLLLGLQIRRILCVPFYVTDFLNAAAAREITGAPLCTYVMDDQVLHARDVPAAVAQNLFAVSDLRLAISPEMVREYEAWFKCSFGLLPPVVTSTAHVMPNRWSEAMRPARHCAMVGNVWSAKQFEQLRGFSRAAGLKVDWFGNANVAWLPQDRDALEHDGIFRRGFLPEDQLATRLAQYPFVVIPSGTLDGTEDNEWLTRLSLPSRMVFILTKTFTPMLILGSARTAAARFVERFGLGTSSNYDADEAREKIEQIVAPEARDRLREHARELAACFLLPDCGAWIWRSLAAKRPEPTPFDHLYPLPAQASGGAGARPTPALAETPEDRMATVLTESPAAPQSFAPQLAAIILKLSDHAFLDGFLPPDEPRQIADLRGAVRFLHVALNSFGSLPIRLLAAERLALMAPNSRPVLVAWAELLEQAGEPKEAAANARKALSLFYDDVHTQTLFMRCAGETNYHADGKDLFCARPFRNFEIYEDGAVHVCNCTCVPFPVGNAITQTAEEIWQSPVAIAIRGSILDGSFRFCSPMTCPWRFALPKRSGRPEEFALLQRIGIEGTRQKPQHLNLSYDRSCNLSCPSCRNQSLMANKAQQDKFDRIRDRVVTPLLETAETVYITGSGDAFGSPHFRGILKQLCDPHYKVEIILGTNGQLLTPRLWREFEPLHARFRDITISIDGAIPATYERLRRGATWARLQVTMEILRAARQARHIRRLKVNMVVQCENFAEMRPLLALCKAWAVDAVCFYRLRQWGNIRPDHYLASDIVNPLHPRHRELLAELAHPNFADPIVDHYDMYELIAKAQASRRCSANRAPPPNDETPAPIVLNDAVLV